MQGAQRFADRRVFDAYAAHSWASGTSPFADGNNQESSSEATTAWAGLQLWARARGNAELEELAARRGAVVHYLTGRDPDCLAPQRLARLVPGLAGHDVYLCGPPRMALAARRGLLGAGLPARRLHEERFAF